MGELLYEIETYIRQNHKKKYKVFLRPFAVFMHHETAYVEPDIFVVSDKDKIADDGYHGAPDWIIEIVSPDTVYLDCVLKLKLYATEGVKEYWVIDTDSETAVVYNFEKGSAAVQKLDRVSSILHPDFKMDFGFLQKYTPITRPNVVHVELRDNYTLYLEFSNGEKKFFEVKPYIKGDYYGQLEDIEYFKQVDADGYTVGWPKEQDLCPDELYYNSIPLIYKYEYRIWWSEEDKCFLAEVPELPGCMADGETLKELYQEVKEHIELWLEVNEESGIPAPLPKVAVGNSD